MLFPFPFPFTHPALLLHTVLSGGKTITNELISTCHWKACWNAASEWEVKEKKKVNLRNTTVLYWFLLSYLSSWSRYPALSKGEPPLPEEQLPASEAWLILPSNPSSPLPPALLAHSVSWCISFVQVCRKLFFFPAGLFLCWITTQRSATVRKGEKVRGRSFHSSNKLLDQLRQTRTTKEKCPEILLPDLDTT